MVKQILLPIIGVAVFIVAVGLFLQKSKTMKLPGSLTPSSTTAPSGRSMKVEGKSINVEIANTKDLRAKGLSGRSSLDINRGMLFTFESKNVNASFWMKDMLIPLDIIWVSDGKVIKIDKNVQPSPPETPDNQLKIYSAGVPIDYVLEVNPGFSDKNNFKVGSKVTLPTDL